MQREMMLRALTCLDPLWRSTSALCDVHNAQRMHVSERTDPLQLGGKVYCR